MFKLYSERGVLLQSVSSISFLTFLDDVIPTDCSGSVCVSGNIASTISGYRLQLSL